jgi:quercetin dioxygenase-like cupin family protein
MRLLTSLTALLFALTLAVPSLAQDNLDSTKADPAHHKVVFENDEVRVVRWVIPVGDKTLMHSHPDSLIVDLTDYNGRVTTPDGKTFEVHAKAGSVTWRPAVTHVVENIGTQPMEGLIVEPKNPSAVRRTGGN